MIQSFSGRLCLPLKQCAKKVLFNVNAYLLVTPEIAALKNDKSLGVAALSLPSRTVLLRHGMGTPMPYCIKENFIH